MQALRLPMKGVSAARIAPASKHNAWSRVAVTRRMCRPVAFKEDDSKEEVIRRQERKIQQGKTGLMEDTTPTPLQDIKDLANLATAVPTTDPEGLKVSWFTPAFTRRREVWMGRIAMLGFFGICVGEILTGRGPVGQLVLETGLSHSAIVSILTGVLAYNFIGGLNPWSATFAPENVKDISKRPVGPPLHTVNPSNIKQIFGITGFGFTKENEIFQGRLCMLGVLGAVLGEMQTGRGPIARLFEDVLGISTDYKIAAIVLGGWSILAIALALRNSNEWKDNQSNLDVY